MVLSLQQRVLSKVTYKRRVMIDEYSSIVVCVYYALLTLSSRRARTVSQPLWHQPREKKVILIRVCVNMRHAPTRVLAAVAATKV